MSFRRSGAIALCLLATASLAFRDTKARTVKRLALRLPAADVARLGDLGYDILAVAHDGAWVDVIAPASAPLGAERALGLEVLDERELDGTYGPDRGYRTPDEVAAFLQETAARHPDLASVRSIGKSTEGRDIWAVRISSDAKSLAGIVTKPVVLFNAMHHAREVMSTEVALDTVEQLVSGYGQDERVTRWVDENVIWVVPMLNVDGSQRVWTADSLWRKNTRGGYGVDLNRNYPYEWGTCNGSSGRRQDEDYRGEAPASEVETQAMMRFVTEIRPVASISYHSYGEYVLYPYGCSGERTPRTDVVETIGRELAAKIPTDDGRGTYRPGTPWELLYSADGGDIDWLYHEMGVLPFVVELNAGFGGGGFQPPFARRQPTVEALRSGWAYLLDRIGGPGVRGRVARADGAPVAARIAVAKVGDAASTAQIYRAAPDGTYHIVLRPGSYALTFEDEQGGRVTREVTLTEARRSLSIVL